MQFKIPYDLPIAQKRIYYSEFTNAMYLVLLKYLATQDNLLIASMFDEIISSLTGEDAKKMFVFDKFCLLIDIRSVVLGDKVDLQTKQARVTITLSSIIKKLISHSHQIKFQQNICVEDVIITTHMPRRFFHNDIDELLNDCIYTIYYSGETHAFDDMSHNEQSALLQSLPASVVTKILDHIKVVKQSTADVDIISANAALDIDTLPFDVYGSTLFSFIKSMYHEDLMHFYEMNYNIVKKLELSNNHFMSMTPNESKIFVNLHNRDIKKQQEEETKQKQPTGRFSGIK